MKFEAVFGYQSDTDIVSHTRCGPVSFGEFRARLATASATLRQHFAGPGQPCVALYCEDTYEFCVLLFAALACDARVVIPANNKRSTINSLAGEALLLGEWCTGAALAPEQLLRPCHGSEAPSEFRGAIQLFTSGSSGEPQAVDKPLSHLLTEVAAQQQHWPEITGEVTTLATVSHQHIYGLLFKLLWSLVAGRPFVSKTYVDVARLLEDAAEMGSAVWVSSPAQLSRRVASWPWHHGRFLRGIFSSGGPLAGEDARAIAQLSGHPPTEIFGSTETGGIAWRRQSEDCLWRPLPGVDLACSAGGLLQVKSPWLDRPVLCQDRVNIESDGRMQLLGRADRIVKIEEKRISLSQIEQMLRQSEWVADAVTLPVERTRRCVAAVVAVNEAGAALLSQSGKTSLVRLLRKHLAPDLEGVALPRLWRFVDAVPTNQQGKTPRELLMQMFDATPAAMLPRVKKTETRAGAAVVEFTVPDELPCLPGHFDGTPVVPGVVQIDWAMHYGRELLGLAGRFQSMEVIKFKQLMLPGESVLLELAFDPSKKRLTFCFRCATDGTREFSSGKLSLDHG